MRSFLAIALVCCYAAAFIGCDADVRDSGSLPKVEVQGGSLPEVDVKGPDVDVDTKKETIAVPDVDVTTHEKEVTIPDVNVDAPNETDQ